MSRRASSYSPTTTWPASSSLDPRAATRVEPQREIARRARDAARPRRPAARPGRRSGRRSSPVTASASTLEPAVGRPVQPPAQQLRRSVRRAPRPPARPAGRGRPRTPWPWPRSGSRSPAAAVTVRTWVARARSENVHGRAGRHGERDVRAVRLAARAVVLVPAQAVGDLELVAAGRDLGRSRGVGRRRRPGPAATTRMQSGSQSAGAAQLGLEASRTVMIGPSASECDPVRAVVVVERDRLPPVRCTGCSPPFGTPPAP